MYRICVMYPQQEGKRFDFEYYLNRHLPMVWSLLQPFGLKTTEVDEGLTGGGGAPPPYLVIAYMHFAKLEDFQRGMKEHESTIVADVPNYTDITPVFQVSRIR